MMIYFIRKLLYDYSILMYVIFSWSCNRTLKILLNIYGLRRIKSAKTKLYAVFKGPSPEFGIIARLPSQGRSLQIDFLH